MGYGVHAHIVGVLPGYAQSRIQRLPYVCYCQKVVPRLCWIYLAEFGYYYPCQIGDISCSNLNRLAVSVLQNIVPSQIVMLFIGPWADFIQPGKLYSVKEVGLINSASSQTTPKRCWPSSRHRQQDPSPSWYGPNCSSSLAV